MIFKIEVKGNYLFVDGKKLGNKRKGSPKFKLVRC